MWRALILNRQEISMTNHPLGELIDNEPMSKHTTWRVGGVAQRYFKPASKAALIQFVQQLPADEPLFWLGLGSNLLVRDGGIKGTVIAQTNQLNALNVSSHSCYAEVGVTCAKVARATSKAHLTGVEFLAGIPGTIGGALAMNAGAFGGETWDWVTEVEILTRSGVVQKRLKSDFEVGYRKVNLAQDEYFLSATLALNPAEDESGAEKIKALLKRRGESQPTNKPTCGSVFKNPEGHHAAKLIESIGLKGYKLGGACISPKHANFIENMGHASARDIESLIYYIQEQVAEKTGIQLVTEAKIVGISE